MAYHQLVYHLYLYDDDYKKAKGKKKILKDLLYNNNNKTGEKKKKNQAFWNAAEREFTLVPTQTNVLFALMKTT